MSLKGARYIDNIYAVIKNSGPLHIGTGEQSILLDEETSMPYIPATSIAGVFRAYASEIYCDEHIEKYFGIGGRDSLKSKIFFYDAMTDRFEIELRPGLKIDENTGTAFSEKKGAGHNFRREFLGKGHEFIIRIEAFSQNDNERDEIKEILHRCLNAVYLKHIYFGGYKTSGAGEFELLRVQEEEYDLYNGESMFKYLKRYEERKDITDEIKSIKTKDRFVEFNLYCNIESPILIKGMSSNESGQADSISIQNNEGDYIIPGSSLKGLLRARCNKISDYLDIDKCIVSHAFGSSNSSNKKCFAGNVFTSDGIIEYGNLENQINYNRIKVDKFTGGTIYGAKFIEKPVVGDVTLKVKYKKNNDEKDDVVIGMLLLALRDIAVGNLPIGGGNNIGRGRVKCSRMDFLYENKKTVFDFNEKTISDPASIDYFIKSYTGYKGAK